MRVKRDERSWPSTLKIGTKRKLARSSSVAPRAAHGHVAQQHQAGVLAVDLARVDAGLGEEGGLAVARSASGVNARSFDAMTIQMSRPSGLLPSETSFSSGAAAASFRSQATVSA